MKSRGVVGKRIVKIEQSMLQPRDSEVDGGRVNVVHAIVLEDGTRLVPYTIETEHGDYWHDFRVER